MSQNKIIAGIIVFFAALIFVLVMRPFFFSTASSAPAKLPALQQQWQFQADGQIKGALALDEDTLYAASDDGFLYALDLSGSPRWKTHIGPTYSAPAVGPDGAIYISNNNGRVLAVNRSGSIRWSTDVYAGDTWGQNGAAIGGSYLYAPSRGSLCALRLSDGHLDWDAEFLGGEQFAAVSLLPDGTILSPGRGRLNALDSRGEVLWQAPRLTPEQTRKNGGLPPPGTFYVSSGIAVAADRTLLAPTGQSGKLVAMSGDGTTKWEFPARNSAAAVVAADGTIYVTSSIGFFYAVDAYGTEKWELMLTDTHTAPVLAADGTIFVHSLSYLYALSPDGHIINRVEVGDNVNPEASPTLAPDGTLFVATTHGKIVAYAGGHGGLMDSSWPKYQADLVNSGVARVP